MSIALWENSFPIFTTSAGLITGDDWGPSTFGQTNDPIVIDAESPAASYVRGGANNYTIYLTVQDWESDEQTALPVATTGVISLPFSSVARNAVFSSSNGVVNDALLWWSASGTAGTYNINFETYADNTNLVSTSSPAYSPSGQIVTLETAIANPTGWAFNDNANDLVLIYATSASSTTKNLNIQIFSNTGQALTQSIVAEAGIPVTTSYGIFYSSANSSFNLVQTATVGGSLGIEFSPINLSTGAIGAATFNALPSPTVNSGSTSPVTIDGYSLVTLSNGDILEFVGWNQANAANPNGIETRLLNSSFVDITNSTPSFTSVDLDVSAAHWAVTTLNGGISVLVSSSGSGVNMEEFGTDGNASGQVYGVSPQIPAGSSTLFPLDFDSVIAMGSRFEITYQVADPTTGLGDVYGAIYDTATQAYSYTLSDPAGTPGQWVGTPFNDTVTYGAGVNEVNGGGGTDTFVATAFQSSQVSITINQQGNVVFSDGSGDIDTLERFSTVALANATVGISGDVLTQTNTDGSKVISTFNIAGHVYTTDVLTYAANGELKLAAFSGVTGQGNLSSFDFLYAGNNVVGTDEFLTGITGQSYTSSEDDYNGANQLARAVYTGVTGAPYSAYEYDYVGGVFAGSKFVYTAVPNGATYSSYEVDYNNSNTYAGEKFSYTNITGQPYSGEEKDFDASGNLTRDILTGVTGQSYSTLEYDYPAYFNDEASLAYKSFQNGAVTSAPAYKAYYTGLAGRSYTAEEVDVSAANQIQKVVYSGMTGSYSSVEQDYSGGAVADIIYGFTDVKGATYNAYQVEDAANGSALMETFDLNSGGHAIIGLANNLTLMSVGNDKMTGGGTSETFLFSGIYGADTIIDFAAHATGAGHDTISLATSEFANFASVMSAATNSGSNVLITAADGDTLTLKGMTTTTLSGLGADFTFHA